MSFFWEQKNEPAQKNNLANVRCPACQKMRAYLLITKKNACIMLRCRSCGGALSGERMIAVYLKRLSRVPGVDIEMNRWDFGRMETFLGMFEEG